MDQYDQHTGLYRKQQPDHIRVQSVFCGKVEFDTLLSGCPKATVLALSEIVSLKITVPSY